MILVVASMVPPQLSFAQIFDEDIAFFKENLVTIVTQTGRDELYGFAENVLPALNRIYDQNEFGIRDNLENITSQTGLHKDFMIFAYEKSRIKLRAPLGLWDDAHRDNFFFVMELICPIREFLNLKPESYQSRMRRLNIKIVRDYYAGTLRWLSLNRGFYRIRLEIVQKSGEFPSVEQILSPVLLDYADGQAGGER